MGLRWNVQFPVPDRIDQTSLTWSMVHYLRWFSVADHTCESWCSEPRLRHQLFQLLLGHIPWVVVYGNKGMLFVPFQNVHANDFHRVTCWNLSLRWFWLFLGMYLAGFTLLNVYCDVFVDVWPIYCMSCPLQWRAQTLMTIMYPSDGFFSHGIRDNNLFPLVIKPCKMVNSSLKHQWAAVLLEDHFLCFQNFAFLIS